MEDVFSVAEERRVFREHFERTGGTFSNHEHGGNCYVCGANCIWDVIFYHVPSNAYVRVGSDCAEKLGMGDVELFRKMEQFKKGVASALEFKAGKAKAKIILDQAGLSEAWELFNKMQEMYEQRKGGQQSYALRTIHDMVAKLIQYGGFSEKQIEFLKKLIYQEKNREVIEAQRAAEKAQAADCPRGKVQISGEILKIEQRETQWGYRDVMTVKSESGFIVWGSAPSRVEIKRGDKISFVAEVEPSQQDPKFGFYKRPAKVVKL